MAMHLIWGNDTPAIERELGNLVAELIDPNWISFNLTKLNGTDSEQARQAIQEARTPPFGLGNKLVILKNSPFFNNCSKELANLFENEIELIAQDTHLILINGNKPDGRLKTTKYFQKLIKSKKAIEKKFLLPAVWDEFGQKELVKNTANQLGLKLNDEAILSLVEAIGNDSTQLSSELEKLALHATIDCQNPQLHNGEILITVDAVQKLISGISTNALKIGDALLANEIGEALLLLDALLNKGEPSLRILATLTGQVRGWLWISLLEKQGERDVGVIAKAAGIANPKRIYVMRKQLQGKQPESFLALLSKLLDIEVALKKGVKPGNAFKDGLLKISNDLI